MTNEKKTLKIPKLTPGKRTLLEVLILILSGLGMQLSYPPVNVDFFAWVCVIPLLWVTLNRSVKRAFLYGPRRLSDCNRIRRVSRRGGAFSPWRKHSLRGGTAVGFSPQ